MPVLHDATKVQRARRRIRRAECATDVRHRGGIRPRVVRVPRRPEAPRV